jgi:hypothetical protein
VLDRDEVSHVIKGTLWSYLRMATFSSWIIGSLLLIPLIGTWWVGEYEVGLRWPIFTLMFLVVAITGSIIIGIVWTRTDGTETWQL